jgi:CHAT domain-containing protein
VETPPELGLAPLRATALDGRREGEVLLTGRAATPRRVLAEMSEATEVELHVHGWVNLGLPEASLLVLAPEADGQYALTAADVRRQHLRRAPFVVLGACHSAHTPARLHEIWSLPMAFLEAGARAVLASPEALPDIEAQTFLDEVQRRVRGGEPPALALRNERMEQLGAGAGAAPWVRRILLFE